MAKRPKKNGGSPKPDDASPANGANNPPTAPKRGRKHSPAIGADGKILSLRKLSAALARHGVERSHVALSRTVKDARWEEMGFAGKAPWFEKDLPAMARWISEHLQEDRARSDADATATRMARRRQRIEEDKDFANVSLDEAEKLIETKGLDRVTEFAKLKLLVERAANERLDRMIKEAQYVKREEIDRADAKKREAIKQGLERFAKAMRRPLADETDPGKVEQILLGSFRKLCNEGFGGRW